jgi:ferritin-like metal-binding protein YciE
MATVKSWFSKMMGEKKLDNLECLLCEQLKHLYDAEHQLIDALPKMERAAASTQLRAAFRSHLEETKHQKTRLEQAFRILGKEPERETCEAMQGLIEEGGQICDLEGNPEVKDAALIAAAQRVEHYEMAGYGCARTFASHLGHQQIVQLLQETLDEERSADEKLTDVAEGFINQHAARA